MNRQIARYIPIVVVLGVLVMSFVALPRTYHLHSQNVNYGYGLPPPPVQYHPLAPARILDTRNGTGGFSSPVGPNATIDVQVTGNGGVPVGATAAVINVTETNTTASSYLTVFPTGAPRPLASNQNWVAGITIANLVEISLGAGGKLSVYNAYGNVDVIFDVQGYVSAPTGTPGTDGLYNPLVPARILDTRNGTGGFSSPVGPNTSINVQVTGQGGVPAAHVEAVVLNLTVTNPTASSYLTAFPTGSAQPLASNINFVAGQTIPNRVLVKLGTGGKISIYNAFGNVDVLADVGGWFTDGTDATAIGAVFTGLTPSRIVDTRNGTGGFSSPVGPNSSIAVMVAGQGGVPPTGTTAAVLNVTVTNPTAPSYLTVWPDGTTRPLASDLNFVGGLTIANLVIVKLGSNGKVDIYNAAGSTDVIVDVVGWYQGG